MKKDSGILGKNDFREEGSNQPEYTGKCTIGGTEYKIGAWVKESEKDGKKRKYFSLSFQQIGEAYEKKPKPEQKKGSIEDMEDSIPW